MLGYVGESHHFSFLSSPMSIVKRIFGKSSASMVRFGAYSLQKGNIYGFVRFIDVNNVA